MYTIEELIAQIDATYRELGWCQDDILSARLSRDPDGELKALHKMEGLVIGVQQEFSVLREFLKEIEKDLAE